MTAPECPPDVADALTNLGVSRETLARLEIYANLLTTWNAKVNLVGKSTIPELWRRHVLDCAQLLPFLPPGPLKLADFGSGAGLPGLLLAILTTAEIHLIEADSRKCAFLREAARVTDSAITIHAKRLEDIAGFPVDVVTARALAPLTDLLNHARPFLTPTTICLFLKGQAAGKEIEEARRRWSFEVSVQTSRTESAGAVLILQKVAYD